MCVCAFALSNLYAFDTLIWLGDDYNDVERRHELIAKRIAFLICDEENSNFDVFSSAATVKCAADVILFFIFPPQPQPPPTTKTPDEFAYVTIFKCVHKSEKHAHTHPENGIYGLHTPIFYLLLLIKPETYV